MMSQKSVFLGYGKVDRKAVGWLVGKSVFGNKLNWLFAEEVAEEAFAGRFGGGGRWGLAFGFGCPVTFGIGKWSDFGVGALGFV